MSALSDQSEPARWPMQFCPECGKPEPFQPGPGYCEHPEHRTDPHAVIKVVPEYLCKPASDEENGR